ncbi:keratin, type II cytoskeletal 60 kDa, component III [Melia azedarach]|uniref:Keratin, type II cytoskeletal 60 kDa, component III n=1 Tax=Melia azedarach TaxID=155640 RepID=A0ACC1X8N5_MELAZ|nr:keratin, type II cytoskeletal 60 kDa, component III [Melia azedarach]
MKTKSKYSKADHDSLWNWNGRNKKSNRKKQFPVTEFLQENYRKLEERMLGPGVGLGIGCGIGAGFGLVGGVGYGGYLKLVFGVGMGCGVGVGFGYGQGFGYGFDLESHMSKFKNRSDSEKRFAIDY